MYSLGAEGRGCRNAATQRGWNCFLTSGTPPSNLLLHQPTTGGIWNCGSPLGTTGGDHSSFGILTLTPGDSHHNVSVTLLLRTLSTGFRNQTGDILEYAMGLGQLLGKEKKSKSRTFKIFNLLSIFMCEHQLCFLPFQNAFSVFPEGIWLTVTLSCPTPQTFSDNGVRTSV